MNIRHLVGFAAALLITVSESAAFSSPVLSRASQPAVVEVDQAVPEIVVTATRLPRAGREYALVGGGRTR